MQKYEYFQTGMSENGTIHITMMKNCVSHILFLKKRGLIVYLAALKRGLFAPHIRTMSYIGSYPPPPPPPRACLPGLNQIVSSSRTQHSEAVSLHATIDDVHLLKIVCEYDQARGRAIQPSRDTRKTN